MTNIILIYFVAIIGTVFVYGYGFSTGIKYGIRQGKKEQADVTHEERLGKVNSVLGMWRGLFRPEHYPPCDKSYSDAERFDWLHTSKQSVVLYPDWDGWQVFGGTGGWVCDEDLRKAIDKSINQKKQQRGEL